MTSALGEDENDLKTQDWDLIRQKYPLLDLPHRNATPKDDWRDYYDLRTVDMVYKLFQKDIEAFGYDGEYRQLVAYLLEKEGRKAM